MMGAVEPHVMRAGELAATYHPGAGMVCSSLTREGRELLGQKGGLEAYVERGSTFGIPFLYPWANRLSQRRFELGGRTLDLQDARGDENGIPIHGLLAASPDWTVHDASETTLVARHAWDDDRRLEQFPFPHQVELSVALGEAGLTVTTTVTPTADVAVPVAFGFHPYLNLAADRAAARIALPVRRRVLVDDVGLPTGGHQRADPERGPLGERTFDDCFDRLEAGRPFVADGEHERLSVVLGEGFTVGQVFAPPGTDFICFEPMTATLDALVTGEDLRWARPGSPFSAVWSLGVAAR